jgi:hypothetical protein
MTRSLPDADTNQVQYNCTVEPYSTELNYEKECENTDVSSQAVDGICSRAMQRGRVMYFQGFKNH